VLPTMAGWTEQVCVLASVLLWKWLGKRCHMSYHYSAIPHFRELFDCPSYCCCSPAKTYAPLASINIVDQYSAFCVWISYFIELLICPHGKICRQ
jgi:hypothetical protein